MDTTAKLDDSVLNNIAAKAKEQSRGTYFAGLIFASVSVAITALFAFLWITRWPDFSITSVLRFIGIIAIYSYCAYRYFQSVKSSTQEDWTLANQLAIQIEKAEKQVKLYKDLPTVFVLPTFIVVVAATYFTNVERGGGLIPTSDMLLFYVGAIAIFGLTLFGLKWESKRKVEPMLDKLKALQAELMAE